MRATTGYCKVMGRLGSTELLEEGLMERLIETEETQLTPNSYCQLHFQYSADACSRQYIYIYIYIQGPPKKCIHTLTKENSTLYNRLL